MKITTLALTAAALTIPASGWACLEPVLTPAEELARQQAATTMHWGIFFAALAWVLYRFRTPLGERLALWRAAAATPLVARLTIGFAAASLALVVYGNIQTSALPDEGCGGPRILKALF